MDNPIEDDIIALRSNGELPAYVPSGGYGPAEVPCVDSLTPAELGGCVMMTAKFTMVPNIARLPDMLMRLGFYYLGLRVYRFDGRTYERISDDAAKAEFNCLLSDILERCEGRDLSLTRAQKADIVDNWKGLRGFEADADGRIVRCDAPASFRSDDRYRGALIPFMNGLYNVRLRTLVPFTPYLFIDRCVQADLDPSDCEECERVYRGILPDEETRRLFYLAAGYTLYSPCSDLGVAFILLGDAETGKSAMTESIQALLGAGTYSKASASSLSLQFGKARLIGKLANFSDESKTAKGSHVDVEVLKELITGEEADTDIKYGSAVTFRITSKLWFASNEMPDFGGVDPGLLRRMRVFPCDVKQDTDARIKDIMRSPRGLAWLAWRALDEYERFLFGTARRFGESDLMSDRKRALTLQDTLYEFLMERFDTVETRVVYDALVGTDVRTFYFDYDMFTRESGRQPYSRAKVLSRLSSNYKVGTKRSRRVPRDAFGNILSGTPPENVMVFADADEVAEINARRREKEKERKAGENKRAEEFRRAGELRAPDDSGKGEEGK